MLCSNDANDIGFAVGKSCSDETKYRLLKHCWVPEETYNFPVGAKRKLKFQRKWLFEFHWLAYSKLSDGALCKFCCLFGLKEVGKGGHAAVKSLVLTPFDRWKDAKEQFRYHQNLQYHKNAVVTSQSFMDVHDGKIVDISLQINKAMKLEIEQNRKALSSIIETIIFSGRQDIALRGHRDAGPIKANSPPENDGNFRSLLRFRIEAGDDTLHNHLKTSTFSWTSPQIQNELIEICGNIILDKIIAKVRRAKYFSILADGTTDIGGIEQFSLCVRYVEKIDDREILREDFLKFVPIVDATGEGLSNTVKTHFNQMGLYLINCRGQGYDGARAMSGIFQGCASRIMVDFPHAPYVHCVSHSFNLAVGDSCKISIIRNTIGTINEIINFFRYSAKRQNRLNEAVNEVDCVIKKKRLQRFCETRWVERLDSIITFKEFFVPIYNALEKIHESENDESSKKAFMFQKTIKDGGFIITMNVISEIFSLCEPLSVSLQSKNADLASTINMADNLSLLLKDYRNNAESKFHELFIEAKSCVEEIGEEINIPRIANQQRYRANYQQYNSEDYYRISVYIPLIDHFITQLELRLLAHKELLSKIESILPNKIINLDEKAINASIDLILLQWPDIVIINDNIVKKEALLWKQRWVGSTEKSNNFIDALNHCDQAIFPNIYTIIKTCATVPVTIATPERSFSTLKRIKTYLRNSTGETRLNGLATLSIHREIPIMIEEVIAKFSEKNRRLAL